MKLRRMEFGGFRTFAEPTTFNFGSSPGLYFLEGGKNNVDPSLGSNGVGKSTVWGALSWILFGKTLDGLKAGVLKSWQGKDRGYYGKLFIGRHIVYRSWRPNKLTLDGEVVEQDRLEDALSISFDTFASSVVLAQGGEMFFDLSPVRKLSLFTSMLNLDNWITYSSMAKATVDELEAKIASLERVSSRLEGKLDGLGIEDLQEKKSTWHTDKSAKINKVRGEIRVSTKEFDILNKALKKTKKQLRQMHLNIEQMDEALLVLEKDVVELRGAEDKNTWRAKKLTQEIDSSKKHIKSVVKHKAGTCEHCGQAISKGKLAAHVKALKGELETKNDLFTAMAIDFNRLSIKLDTALANLKTQEEQREVLSASIHKKREKLEQLIRDCTLIGTALRSKRDRMAAIKGEVNPFVVLIRERQEIEERLEKKLKTKAKMLVRKKQEKENVGYWVQGFKEVRLYLIEEALDQLEIETNKALPELGFSSDWQIKYSIDRRAKTGTSITGFNVLVKSPYSKEQVPFAAWSGGEKQRLRIAGSIGFIALLSARTGIDLGLEVYDEPTQHLNAQGIDSLLETLRQRAVETGKRIWLVDQHTLDYGDFTGRVVVDKHDSGSKIWQS